MLKKSFFLIIIIISIAVISCKRKDCVCSDLFEDALYFDFDTTSGQFTVAEIGKVYVLRYNKTDTVTPKDSFLRTTPNFQFAIGIDDKGFENYVYKIAGTGTYPYKYWVTDIRIQGENNGDCNCYANTVKKCKINNVETDRSASDNVIILKK